MTPQQIRQATLEALEPLETAGFRLYDSRLFPEDIIRETAESPAVSVFWTGATENYHQSGRYSSRRHNLVIVSIQTVTGADNTDAGLADAAAETEALIRDCLLSGPWARCWSAIGELKSDVTLEAAGTRRTAQVVITVTVTTNAVQYVPDIDTSRGTIVDVKTATTTPGIESVITLKTPAAGNEEGNDA